MKAFSFLFCIGGMFFSCKMSNNDDGSVIVDGKRIPATNKVYKFQLQPEPGSTYYFEITNTSTTIIKTDGEKSDQLSRTTAGVYYNIQRDSAGNFIVSMTYDKIKLHTEKDDKETDFDAANASATFNPVERMLGILKEAKIVATVSPAGETISVSGYGELAEKVLGSMHGADINTRKMARSQWDELIEKGIIKKNIEQLFRIFPDSSVKVGDSWTLRHSQEGEISLDVASEFTLERISRGKAVITSNGKLSQSKPGITMMGVTVSGNLAGTQEGSYEVDIETGMLSKSTLEIRISGSIEVIGRKVPVTIKNTIKMSGKKV